MGRQASFAVFATAVLVVALIRAPQTSAPIRLARHPDYHAGKIAFSYLGDIWTANEDGTSRAAPHRQRRARGLSALLAGRPVDRLLVEPLRQQRRVRRPGRRRHAEAPDVSHRQRRSGRLDARFAAGHLPRRARRRRVPERRDALPGRRSTGGQETAAAASTGATGAASRPTASRSSSTAIPRCGRASTIAAATPPTSGSPNLGDKTYTKLLGDERYNRYWPMWGADDAIYFVADPLPNDKSVEAGQPGGPQERQQHLQDSGERRHSRCRSRRHTDGNVFWPSMSSDGKVIVYEEQLRHLEARRRVGQDERDQARHHHRREGQRERRRNGDQRGRRVRHLAVRPPRGDLGARTDSDDRHRPRRHHARRARQDGVAQRVAEDGRPTASTSRSSPIDRAATKSGSAIRKAGRPKKITDLDNEKGALVWTPDSKSLLYTAADKKLYSYTRRRRRRPRSSRRATSARIGSVAVSPDSKWVAFSKQDRTLRSHVYIAPIAGGEERHVSDDSLLYSESNAVWTADGRYIVFTSSEGLSNGIATQGGIAHDDGAVGAVAARSGSRSDEPRHRQRGAGARGGSGGAAEPAAARRRGRRDAAPPDVRIDWSGLARRARRLTVPGTTIGGLTAAPDGHRSR